MKITAPIFLSGIERIIDVEQRVGLLWHRFVSKTKIKHYPGARVNLDEVRQVIGIMYRAFGGIRSLKIVSQPLTEYSLSQTLLQRLSGNNQHLELTWCNESFLNLPTWIDIFPEKSLNNDLYLWLSVLASGVSYLKQDNENSPLNWLENNRRLSNRVLNSFPGLVPRYKRLVAAQLELHLNSKALSTDEIKSQLIIKKILQNPELDVPFINHTIKLFQPVYLWLYPSPKQTDSSTNSNFDVGDPEDNGETVEPEHEYRYQAENVDMPKGNTGLVLNRFEAIFSWAEYIKVDRDTDEDEELDSAQDAAKDLDKLSITRDKKAIAKRIRFDLDLPSVENDDTILDSGILLSEWDYRQATLIKDYCCLQEMISDTAKPIELPARLRKTAKQLRNQFQLLQPSRIWYRAQQEGSELDLENYLDFVSQRKHSHASAEKGFYRDFRTGTQDIACLLLADLSLSTDTWVNNEFRVIDVIRDSLLLFSEALSASSDKFAIYGFSSRYRDNIRFHTLKKFTETHSAISRGRINAIKPGFYTRMGAAIRHASSILSNQCSSQQLLLILTDGKPNDLDLYDGRYGIEDTRMALIEARQKGLHVFCVTIDQHAGDYLPHMFGTNNYVVIRKPSELPRELPLLYARLNH